MGHVWKGNYLIKLPLLESGENGKEIKNDCSNYNRILSDGTIRAKVNKPIFGGPCYVYRVECD